MFKTEIEIIHLASSLLVRDIGDRIYSGDQFIRKTYATWWPKLWDFYFIYSMSFFFSDQMQKFESTRNKIGFQYSPVFNEPYIREVFVSKFHTSVVTLKEPKLGVGAKNSDE